MLNEKFTVGGQKQIDRFDGYPLPVKSFTSTHQVFGLVPQNQDFSSTIGLTGVFAG